MAPTTDANGGTAMNSVFTLMNAAVGAGVLSIPYAFKCLGVALGPIIALTIVCLEISTLCILVRAGDRMGANSYQDLVLAAFGQKMSTFVAISLVVYLVGSCAAYLIIIGDTLTPLVKSIVPESWHYMEVMIHCRRIVISVVSILFVLPVSLLRSLESFAMVSALAPVCLGFTTVCVMIRAKGVEFNGSNGLPEGAVYVREGMDWILGFPIILFAFQCHIQVNQVYRELEERPTFSFWKKRETTWPTPTHANKRDSMEESLINEEYPENEWVDGDRVELDRRSSREKVMYTICGMALLICLLAYALVGIFGYFIDPTTKETNILNIFSHHDALIQGARVAMCIVAIVSYPVNHYSARSAIDDLITSAMNWPKSPPTGAPTPRHVALTLGFFMTTLVISLIVSNLGSVFELIGSTVGSLVVLVLPAMMLWPGAVPLQYCTSPIEEELEGEGGSSVWGSKERSLFGTHVIYKIYSSMLITLGCGVALITILMKFNVF